jgi:uncharacterized membrane protein
MRDISIDVTRGLAIFMMIAANILPYLLMPPVPLPVRIYGTFAAPIFVTLAGMMVALTGKKHRFGYFLERGAIIILIGVLIDVFLWNVYPFVGVDVLYLIGISLPIAHLFLSLDGRLRWAIIGLIFLLTPVLQYAVGYREVHYIDTSLNGIAHSLLIDGYFPLFPWLGFSLLGAQLGTLRWKAGDIKKYDNFMMAAIIIALLVIGSILWVAFPGNMYTREGYAELFYPPTIGFIITAIGVILLAIGIFDALNWKRLLEPFRSMGTYSLQIYVVHLMVVALVIQHLGIKVGLPMFILAYLLFSAVMYIFSLGLREIKAKPIL